MYFFFGDKKISVDPDRVICLLDGVCTTGQYISLLRRIAAMEPGPRAELMSRLRDEIDPDYFAEFHRDYLRVLKTGGL